MLFIWRLLRLSQVQQSFAFNKQRV